MKGGRLNVLSPGILAYLGFSSKSGLHDAEAFRFDAFLHLAEVVFAWCLVTVATNLSEAEVSSQLLHQVFVGYLLYLAELKGLEVPFGVVFDMPPRGHPRVGLSGRLIE